MIVSKTKESPRFSCFCRSLWYFNSTGNFSSLRPLGGEKKNSEIIIKCVGVGIHSDHLVVNHVVHLECVGYGTHSGKLT